MVARKDNLLGKNHSGEPLRMFFTQIDKPPSFDSKYTLETVLIDLEGLKGKNMRTTNMCTIFSGF